jgi:hypothetical protein
MGHVCGLGSSEFEPRQGTVMLQNAPIAPQPAFSAASIPLSTPARMASKMGLFLQSMMRYAMSNGVPVWPLVSMAEAKGGVRCKDKKE